MKVFITVVAFLAVIACAGLAEGLSNNQVTKVQEFNTKPVNAVTVYDLQPSVDASYLQSTYNPQ